MAERNSFGQEAPLREWGLPAPEELDRVVIVSPHLDDAVLGCAHFMAAHPGATVITVFAGNPRTYPTDPMRQWDVQSGFSPGDDVMETRRKEDHAALASLDATPVHLEFVEHTYNPGNRPVADVVILEALAPALAALTPTLVLVPFGLANPDHDATHRACMLARDRMDETVAWWCYEESQSTETPCGHQGCAARHQGPPAFWLYEDMGYKHIPGMLARRVSQLFRRGIWPTPVCPPTSTDEARKRAAIACYSTQLLALEDDWAIGAKLDAPAPEQFWRLEPPPSGWELLAQE